MANNRIFYAVQQAGLSICGANTFTSLHGLTSIGVNTKFSLEHFFEIGQISVYESAESIPDVEITLEKQLDGYPPVYVQATRGAASASLAGRSAVKTTLGLSIYSDVQDSASGTPLAQMTASGLYCQSVGYNIAVQGASTESVTLVGNNKTWLNTFTATAFNNDDVPYATYGSGGVSQRENIKFGPTDTTDVTASLLPLDIPGITASGTNVQGAGGAYGAHIQSIKCSANLGREALYELGRRGVYYRYTQFPVAVKTEIETISTLGDGVEAIEDNESNLTDRRIYLMFDEGLIIDLGRKNKLESISMAGAQAQANGGNQTLSYSYTNFNDLTVLHENDPTTILRP